MIRNLFLSALILALLFSCSNNSKSDNQEQESEQKQEQDNKPEIPNPKPDASNQKPDTQNPTPDTQNPIPDISDSTTITEIVSTFNSTTPATTEVPSGNAYVINTSSRDITTLDNDYQTEMNKISNKITIDLEDEDSWDSTAITRDGELVTIQTTDNIEIEITGTTTTKTALFFANKKEKNIKLVLNNANFSSQNYPCIEFDKKAKIYFVANGTNTLTDGRTYGTGFGKKFQNTDSAETDTYVKNYVKNGSNKKGSVYIKGQAILSGSGSLVLNENYKHGIYATDYIRIFNGAWTVNSTGRNAIQSVNGFIMDDGEITINGTGENTNNESRGIVVEGLDFEDNETNEFPGEGFIVIRNGKLKINTVSKAITAKWDIDDDAGSIDTSDDPYPYVFISGGTIDITTTGIPQEESRTAYKFTDADGLTVSEKTKLSPEGIEGKQAVIITGGTISLNVTDDGINASRENRTASGWISISGGNIYINSSKNDAIDSNGNLYISGGVIVAYGTSTPECAFDCDRNTFAITGGLLLGIGTNNYSEPTSSVTTQGTFILSKNNYGNGTFAITDSNDNVVFAYDVLTSIANSSQLVMILSSPNIGIGTYTLKTAVNSKGGEKFHNLYTTLPKISEGTTSITLTTSEGNFVKSSTGSMTNNGSHEGPRPNFGPR